MTYERSCLSVNRDHSWRQESTRKACQAAPSVEKKQSVSVVSTSAGNERISTEIRELKEFVLGMNEKGT